MDPTQASHDPAPASGPSHPPSPHTSEPGDHVPQGGHEESTGHTTSVRQSASGPASFPVPITMPPVPSAHEIISNPSPASTPQTPPSATATASMPIPRPSPAAIPPVPPLPSIATSTTTATHQPFSPGNTVVTPLASSPAAVYSPAQSYFPANPVPGPSRVPVTRSIQESADEDEQPEAGPSGQSRGQEGREGRVNISTHSLRPSDNGNGNGHNGAHHNASLRRPARAVSYSDRTVRPADRYPPLPVPGTPRNLPPVPLAPVAGTGSGFAAELNPDGLMSLRSGQDWNIPYVGRPPDGGPGTGTGNEHPRRRSFALSQAMTGTGTLGENSILDRIQPTLDHAKEQLREAKRSAAMHGWALNIAIGAQVALGALTTGVAAATSGRQTSIATSVLGGMSTLAASYLAKARGSGEPEASALRSRDLESFIRDLESFALDYGHLVGHEHDAMIARYRRRFEEIMGNGFEGVGADSNKPKKRDAEKAKIDSPV